MENSFGGGEMAKQRKPKTLRTIIEGASYLLATQKQRLLGDIPEELLGPKNPPVSEKVLDEILYRVLGISINDLSPMERMALTQILKEFQ